MAVLYLNFFVIIPQICYTEGVLLSYLLRGFSVFPSSDDIAHVVSVQDLETHVDIITYTCLQGQL